MKDELEKFVLNNRDSFDDKEPSPMLWDKIEKAIPEQKTARIIPWFRMAAAASILLLVGMVGFFAYQSGVNQGVAMTLADVSPEMAEAENYYEKEIENKKAILASLSSEEDVHVDLKEMEAFMIELKNELKDVSPNEREVVIQAMIENYRTRLEILERVIDRLPENSKPTKSLRHEINI